MHDGQVRMIQFYRLDEEDANEKELSIMVVREGGQHHDPYGTCSIIVDSGADATVLPISYLSAGVEMEEEGPMLQDAQGEQINIEGYKSVCFVFEAESGKEVQIYEKAHFSKGIAQPILSFGRLMESGWGITDHSLVYGAGDREIKIPLRLQNKSLVAEGSVRTISMEPQMVRVLEAKLKEDLEEKTRFQVGWKSFEDRWIGIHLAKTFQNPQYVGNIPSSVNWKRTTLAKVAGGWQLLEMCEDLHKVFNQEEMIEGAHENVLVVTILTKEAMSVEEMGFEVETGLHLDEQPMVVRDHERAEEEAGIPEEEQPAERVEEAEGEVEPEARLAMGPGVPDHIMVNGIQLTAASPLRQLRAACNFFGVSQSGSRLRYYQRLVSHMKERELKAAAEAVAAAQLQMKEKFDIEVNMAKEYGEEFSFLKRKYVYTAEGLLVKPGGYAANMVKTFEDYFGPVRRQRIPATADIQDYDGSSTVPPEQAAIYRSVVGMGIYLAQERCDIAFCIKELAGKMSSPTEISIQKMKKFLGYLKETADQSMMLPMPRRGSSAYKTSQCAARMERAFASFTVRHDFGCSLFLELLPGRIATHKTERVLMTSHDNLVRRSLAWEYSWETDMALPPVSSGFYSALLVLAWWPSRRCPAATPYFPNAVEAHLKRQIEQGCTTLSFL
eukprot:g29862.t1